VKQTKKKFLINLHLLQKPKKKTNQKQQIKKVVEYHVHHKGPFGFYISCNHRSWPGAGTRDCY
jgi:hypothetical protein